MRASSVQELFRDFIKKGVISQQSLCGCTAEEISSIERHFGCELPMAYRDFMVAAGHGAGKLFRGTDIFYPRLLELQSEAMDLLAELNKSALLPEDAKVFCMHQGYEINFFLPGYGDPPVFQFFEGQGAVNQPWRSFSEFIGTSIESHLKHWKNLD